MNTHYKLWSTMQIPFTDPGNIPGVVTALYPGYFLIFTTAPPPRLVVAFDRQDLNPGQGLGGEAVVLPPVGGNGEGPGVRLNFILGLRVPVRPWAGRLTSLRV